jgi:hypothetical protein
MSYGIGRGIYQMISGGAEMAMGGSVLALGAGIVTGDPNLALTALGLAMAAESMNYTATVGKAMTTLPEPKEGLESKL